MCLQAEPQAGSDLRIGSRCSAELQPPGRFICTWPQRDGALLKQLEPPTNRADQSTAVGGGGEADSAGVPEDTSVGKSKLRTATLDTF